MSLIQRVKGKLNPYRPSKIVQRFDQSISLSLLGHGAGYRSHLQGKRDIEAALKWHTQPSPEALKMREVGFSEISPIDEKLMAKIRKRWADIIDDDDKAAWGSPATRQIKRPQENLPEIKELASKEVLDHFRGYFGTEVKIDAVLCWRNYDPKDMRGEHVFSNWWHFDAANTAIAKLFVAVSDITEKHGPFHIYPRDKTKDLIKMGYVDRRNYGGAPVEDYEGLYRMTGKSGTAVIGNTELCLHKAGEPEDGNFRDIIQFQILPSAQAFDDNWMDNLRLKGIDRK